MLSYARYAIRENAGVKLPLTSTLDNQVWAGPNIVERAQYIEAVHIAGKQIPNSDGFLAPCRHGPLHGDEILEWVYGTGRFPPMCNEDEQLAGGVKLLVLERSLFQPASFDIRKDTFLAIAEHFHLPEATMLAISGLYGTSTHTLDVNEATGVPERLSMVIKAPQKFQVGNYGLAFTHDFTTSITTGLLYGTGVTMYGRDYDLWERPPIDEIFEHMKEARRLWTHPMFLPTIILQHHLLRTDYFCTIILSNKFTDLELQLGTMRGGRLHGVKANFATQMPVQQAKVSLRTLTVAMSTLMFDVIWFGSISEWQCICLKHISEVFGEIEGHGGESKEKRAMRERIQYLLAAAESIRMHNRGMKEVGQTDMSVLYSIISQVDNRLNAKIAAAASRDSAAMKTLAFLTTLFLPGTFVAAVFSTGMFDWQVGGKDDRPDDGRIVSKLFWVYWAFTVPLTLLVGIGWRVWWNWEKQHFDDDVDAAVEAVDGENENTYGIPQTPAPGLTEHSWRSVFGGGLRNRKKTEKSSTN